MITKGKAILKRILLISFLGMMMIGVAPTNSPAQGTIEQRVDTRLKVWTERMKLTEEQQTRIRSILLERERQWDEDHAKVLAASPQDRQKLRDEQRSHMQSYRDKLHNVLTPDQQKLEQKMREMRQSGPRGGQRQGLGRGKGPGSGPRDGSGRRNGAGRHWRQTQ